MVRVMKKLNKPARIVLSTLPFVALFAIWYGVASNNDYRGLSGTYIFHGNWQSCTLRLSPDQTFVKELHGSGEIQTVRGHWHRYGRSHVSFSDEFLELSGEELNAGGEAHGEFDRILGIFPTLVLAPLPGGPTFPKKWLI